MPSHFAKCQNRLWNCIKFKLFVYMPMAYTIYILYTLYIGTYVTILK